MRRSSEPEERAQFTVAELLARYGESAPTTGRRRRRAAEDTAAEDTGTIAETYRVAAPTAQQSRPDLSRPDRVESTQPSLNTLTGRTWSPAVDSPPVTAGSVTAGSVGAGRASFTRTALPEGPVTDQLPRFDPLPMNPAPWSNRRPVNAAPINAAPINAAPITTAPTNSAPTNSAPTNSAQLTNPRLPAGLGTPTRDIPEQHGNVTAHSETSRTESGSPLWEWAAMVSQVGIGVVCGAALWLVCEWLWLRIPVVALVVALAVITGLVWVVRRVRRAEDLQTTVIAVLVGLFVTVSPAALLLVGR